MRNNGVKKIFCQIPVLLLILAILVPMVTAPVSSTMLFSSPNAPVNLFAFAEEEIDSGGDSSGGDQSSSSTTTTDPALASSTTTTDPALASSTTTTDPALASSTTTTDPALGQSLIDITVTDENTLP